MKLSRFSRTVMAAALSVAGLSTAANASVIYSDDFEGTLAYNATTNPNGWTQFASPFAESTTRNAVPAVGGTKSAFADSSADRMIQNLNTEVAGHTTFTFWMFDDDPANSNTASTRMFGEARSYAADGINDGTTTTAEVLDQLVGIGKHNVANIGTFNINKYQGRIVNGPAGTTGYFNLDDAGSPDRSPGWHKFTIERLADGTTMKFYVDDILSRTMTGASVGQSWDTLAFGLGAGTTVTNMNIDGVEIAAVPEPAALAVLGLTAAGLMARRRRA